MAEVASPSSPELNTATRRHSNDDLTEAEDESSDLSPNQDLEEDDVGRSGDLVATSGEFGRRDNSMRYWPRMALPPPFSATPRATVMRARQDEEATPSSGHTTFETPGQNAPIPDEAILPGFDGCKEDFSESSDHVKLGMDLQEVGTACSLAACSSTD